MKTFEFFLDAVLSDSQPSRLELFPGQFCFVVSKNQKVLSVFKDKCSHMGSVLSSSAKGFSCRTHGWMFDIEGQNLTKSNPGLTELSFEVLEDQLLIFTEEPIDLLPSSGASLDGTESLELLAHASFLLRSGEVSLLFDPWFLGDAYWGSWTLWPKNEVSADKLASVTHVVVTHPHPDHFNLESVDKLDRSVSFIFPDFLSGIIPNTLRSMGFENISAAPWEQGMELGDDVSLAFLRPNTVWEDSSVLVRVKDWVWLNQNDAGAPLADHLVPSNIDLLSSSFDTGASGYPLTYEMPFEKKVSIVRNSKQQILASIRQRCEQVRAKNFAPFAGWWRHGLEEHQELAAVLDHTTLQDLEVALNPTATRLLETIPSARLHLKSMSLEYDASVREQMKGHLEPSASEVSASKFSDEEIIEGLTVFQQKLAAMSAAARSEHVVFSVSIEGLDTTVDTIFGSSTDVPISLSVTIPRRIAELFVRPLPNLTWNHLDIGWWGSWVRNTERFPSNFMRLLQLGHVPPLESVEELPKNKVLGRSVADIISADPEYAGKILARAGLPCITCQHQVSETLDHAFKIHSVAATQRSVAIAELAALLSD
jgi:nitrite reductase/ring-hydroxylating ferredoxin subunit